MQTFRAIYLLQGYYCIGIGWMTIRKNLRSWNFCLQNHIWRSKFINPLFFFFLANFSRNFPSTWPQLHRISRMTLHKHKLEFGIFTLKVKYGGKYSTFWLLTFWVSSFCIFLCSCRSKIAWKVHQKVKKIWNMTFEHQIWLWEQKLQISASCIFAYGHSAYFYEILLFRWKTAEQVQIAVKWAKQAHISSIMFKQGHIKNSALCSTRLPSRIQNKII